MNKTTCSIPKKSDRPSNDQDHCNNIKYISYDIRFLEMKNEMKTKKSFSGSKYLFITAFDYSGDHFELFIGIKAMWRMGRDDYSFTQSQFIFFFINNHLGFPVNYLNI